MSHASTSKKTVLITGSSSGIGLATAKYFHKRGFQVIATMRNPKDRTTPLHDISGIDIMHCDVTDKESINHVVDTVAKTYGRLDVVVNNAGFGVIGPFEGLDEDQAGRLFETDFFSVLNMTRKVLPLMREKRQGVIINISSIAGKMGFPKHTLYSSAKWAMEGFSESLSYEVRPFNIHIKLIEPGLIETDFYGRSKEVYERLPKEYDPYVKKGYIFGKDEMQMSGLMTSPPRVVAKTIYRAATDHSWRMRYSCGRFSLLTIGLRKILPDEVYLAIVRMVHWKGY